MIKYSFIALLLTFPVLLKAQTVTATKHPNTMSNVKAIDVEPQFPGGTKAFNKYLSKNVIYPEGASRNELYGAVTIAMAIEKDGSVSEVKIVKGLSDVMDKETIRLMNRSPKWKPGMQGGQPIRVRYTFTINYAVIGDKEK
jgi:protein TonB